MATVEELTERIKKQTELWELVSWAPDDSGKIQAYALLLVAEAMDTVGREMTQMRRLMETWDID